MIVRFFNDQRGNVAILGALLILPLLMMVGVAVDYTRIETAKGGMLSSVNHSSIRPQAMMSDIPGAETGLENFINANSGRDSAQVNIRIVQDILRIEAQDAIDTPLLSVIGQAVSPIVVSVEVPVPETKGRVQKASATNDSLNVKRQQSNRQREQIAALRRFERSLERSIMRLMSQRSPYPRYTQQLVQKLRAQLREVRREIRNAKVR